MNVMHNASWISVFIIIFSCFFVSIYWFFVLPIQKAKKISLITILLASLSVTMTMYALVDRLVPFGGLIILGAWIIPALITWSYKHELKNLNQKSLVFLQIFRLIGALFILEMVRGNIPESFAIPAGIGDIIVGLFALYLFCSQTFTRSGLLTLIVLGMLDFIFAFVFGFTSLPGPQQLFAFNFYNQINLFPTGLIPLFLVPCAIVFHILSYINLEKS